MEGQIENVHEIVRAMKESASYYMLIRNWKTFGLNLGINQVYIDELERKQNMGIMQPKEIPHEVLKIWKADQGTKATLEVLHAILLECGAKSTAEIVLDKFWRPEFIRQVRVMWQGQVITLGRLLGENASKKTYQRIFETFKKYPKQQPINLMKQELVPPIQPKYYIPRILVYIPSTQLDERLFSSDVAKDNVFLFKDIGRQNLAKLSGYKAIDTSGNQLHKVNVGFIEMEHGKDFERISKNTRKPIHSIQHEDGRYFWKKSDKNLDVIRQFLKHNEERKKEKDLLSTIMSLPPSCSLCIADSPGMGKTFLLANLATSTQQVQQNNIVIFIILQEFIQRIGKVASSASALKAVAAYASKDPLSEKILLEIFKSDFYSLNLFLDGYDEVRKQQFDMVDSFLKHVQELKKVKVIVTARPHLRNRLEIILNQFSIKIQPFNETNQVNFLIKYWIDQHGIHLCPNLICFAQQCLAALNSKLTDSDREIAGIPLQCMMLAEVYAKDAERACGLETLSNDTVKPVTLFEMYHQLVELKLNRIEDSDSRVRQNYINAHVYEAIALLFPEWMKRFEPLLSGHKEIDSNTLYGIGLFEKGFNDNTPRFIHRTYAEYIIAEFIVKNLGNYEACVYLLFEDIIGMEKRTKELVREYGGCDGCRGPGDGSKPFCCKINYLGDVVHKLNFPAISYFIELHLTEYTKHNPVKNLVHLRLSRGWLTNNNMCKAVSTCCSNDLESTFEYVSNMFQKYSVWSDLKNKEFKYLLHIVTYTSNNITMLRKVLKFTKRELGADLICHKILNWKSCSWKVQEITPLHLAICMGKYNMTAEIVDQLKEKVRSFKNLVHIALHGSVDENELVIEDRLLILNMLVRINRNWLEEKDENDCTPLHQYGAHLSLLQHLVKCGADINAYSSVYGTVLHTQFNHCFNKNNYFCYTRGTLLSIFGTIAWIYFFARYGFCHLQTSGTELKEPYPTCCSLLSEGDEPDIFAEVVFVAVVLFYKTCMSDGIQSLYINMRRYFHWPNRYAYSGKFETRYHGAYADLLRWAFSSGFNLINHKDKWRRTSLMTAIEAFGCVEEDALELFHEAGADFNAHDRV